MKTQTSTEARHLVKIVFKMKTPRQWQYRDYILQNIRTFALSIAFTLIQWITLKNIQVFHCNFHTDCMRWFMYSYRIFWVGVHFASLAWLSWNILGELDSSVHDVQRSFCQTIKHILSSQAFCIFEILLKKTLIKLWNWI